MTLLRRGGLDADAGGEAGGRHSPGGRPGWCPPRSREATAASAARPAARAKTITRPWWNGPEMRWGKNSRPVTTCRAVFERAERAWLAARRCWRGFTPRVAAKRDDTGGR